MSLRLDDFQRRLVEALPEVALYPALALALKEKEDAWREQARSMALAYALRGDGQDESRRVESLEFNGRANAFRWLREKLEDIVKQHKQGA